LRRRSWHWARFFAAVLGRRIAYTLPSAPRKEITPSTQVHTSGHAADKRSVRSSLLNQFWSQMRALGGGPKGRKADSAASAGFALPMILSIIVAMVIIMTAVSDLVVSNISLVSNNIKSQKALNIAEAGINYYLWHLSHNSADYKDGKTTPVVPDPQLGYGPYEHNYVDDNGVTSGTYTLWIKPVANSTIVDVRSIGKVTGSNVMRTVQAQLGAPSFASYALVADDALWFGANESANGPVHSNQGVRMDGSNNDIVSSSNATYVPSSSLGGNGSTSRPGVWCHSSVTTPINCDTRDKSTWQFPASQVDFNQVNSSLCDIKKQAFAADPSTAALATGANPCSQLPTSRTASYLPQRSSSANNSRGYLIQLNNNNTYDIYNVNNVNDTLSGYTNALNLQSFVTGVTVPPGGVMFVEDNVWIRSNPTFNGRLTIAAGRLATNVNANITVADNLAYSTKNGSVAIGLIAEGSAYIAPFAAPASGSFTLEVNAAMLAQSGSVQYPSNYTFSNNRCTRGWINSNQQLNFYGSVATRQGWTWSWQRGSSCADAVYDSAAGYYVSGFKYNTTTYDYNLLYSPPPSYPTTGTYNILSWREILTKP
jgi:hypothetical protein